MRRLLRIGALSRICAGALAGALLAALLFAGTTTPVLAAQGQGGHNFDHLTTGFALTGQHQSVRCEDCHVRGIFKGTSPQCATCHTPGTLVTAVIIPNNHIPVSQPCDTCHTTNSFYGVHFVHSDVATGTCITCHNGVFAKGESANHIPIGTASCDLCHSTLSFASAYLAVPTGHIPTTQTCSTCHAGGFTLAGTVMNHAGTGGVCQTCHAPSPTPYTFTIPGSVVVGGKTMPVTTNGQSVTVVPMSQSGSVTSGVGGTLHHVPAGASCDQCHTNGIYTVGSAFKNGVMHHGAVVGESCALCHNSATVFAGTGLGAGGEPFQIPGPVGTPGTGDHFPINGLDCGTSGCHAASDTTTANASGFATKLVPALSAAGHTAVALPCAACHTIGMSWKLDSTTMVTPATAHIPPDNSTTPSVACSGCHSATSFATGGFKITSTPVMSVAAHTAVAAAIPLCATCHEANAADLTFQGVLTNIYLRPDTATSGLSKGAGLDVYHGTGNAATQDCSVCHTTAPPFTSASLPTNHIKLNSSSVACADCHATGYGPGISTMKHADVTTATPLCATCHNTSAVFAGTGQGTLGQPWQMSGAIGLNGTSTTHFPVGSVDCAHSGCHTVSDAMTTNGAPFALTAVPALSAAGHTALNLPCQTCHAAGMSWKGIAAMVGATSVHIPPDNTSSPSIACSSCHSSTSFGSGGFKLTGTPGGPAAVLTPAMHATLSSAVAACDTCHEANAADLGFQGVLGQIYLRPNTASSGLSLNPDAAHGAGNAASGDCGACHSTTGPFRGGTLPANHMPLNSSSVACADCHASGYAPGVSTMKHADVTTATPNCATCHNTSTVFSGTGQGTLGEPWQMNGAVGTAGGTSTTHFPLGSATCNSSGCHASSDTMTSNGAGFFISSTNPVLSAAGHTSVNAACETCHGVSASWKGVATLVTPAANHIPPDNTTTTVACSACHSATSFASGGFKLTGTAGTAAPVMTVAMHGAVALAVSGCDACHESGNLSAGDLQFQGIAASIYLRPNNGTNSGLSLAVDAAHGTGTAATADCGGCHSTTPPFTAATLPSGHIPIVSGSACATCHTTSGVYYNVVLPMPHTGYVSGTCASCHNNGGALYAGATFTPAASGGGTFGTQTTGNNFSPKQIVSSPALGTAGGHIPLPSGDDCSVCHAVPTAAKDAFGPGTAMVHTSITSGCATCHSAGASWYGESYTATILVKNGGTAIGSPTHVPILNASGANADCSVCHSPTVYTNFGTTTKVNHTSSFLSITGSGQSSVSTPSCKSCHGPSGQSWYGVSLSTATVGNHHSSASTQDCVDCHSVNNFAAAAAAYTRRTPVRATAGPARRPQVAPPGGATPSADTPAPMRTQAIAELPFTHIGVLPGGCAACHTAGGAAPPVPANHLPTALACDACHRTSAWLPALFMHSGVGAGSCATCHAANWATPKPASHMLTVRGCDACHHGTASWTPQSYAHFDAVYTPHASSVACTACHQSSTEQVVWKYPGYKPGCAGCHGPQPGAAATRRMRAPMETPRAP